MQQKCHFYDLTQETDFCIQMRNTAYCTPRRMLVNSFLIILLIIIPTTQNIY